MLLQKLGAVLHQCAKTKDYKHGISFHALLIKLGLYTDLILCNHLINVYSRCYDLVSAKEVFDAMPQRNLVSWSTLIAGYDQYGLHCDAIEIFARMNLPGNEYVYASAISASGSMCSVIFGKQIHARMVKSGYDSVSFVYNSLISMYLKCGIYDDAHVVFSSVSDPGLVTYNTLIAGFTESLQVDRGLEMFKMMNTQNLYPDMFTFVAVLGICSRMEDMKLGRTIHCQTIKFGLDMVAFVGNVILTMYSKFKILAEVERSFESIMEKDLISWNTVISAYCYCGEHYKALQVYRDMVVNNNIKPDEYTTASVLAACAELALIRYGGQIHAHLIRSKIDFDIGVTNAIINTYAKCGNMLYASRIFHMSEKNLISWNTIIMGLANHGNGEVAVEIFEQMKSVGVKPDTVTFVALLSACSHAGLVEKGLIYYNEMSRVYGITPQIEHLSCLIDLLGRAGRLREAEEYVQKSPFANDLIILGSLLSSCRLHGDILVGEQVAKRLMELELTTSSPYVLLSNLYALDGRWEGAAEARKMLKSSGIKKELGRSWLEAEGSVATFTVGDFSHPRMKEILEVLDGFDSSKKEGRSKNIRCDY